jgi:large subunit ribosomal protein LP1
MPPMSNRNRIWASLLAKAFEGKDVRDLLSDVGSGRGAPTAGTAPVTAASGVPKEEAKDEESEGSDDDMVRMLLIVFVIRF